MIMNAYAVLLKSPGATRDEIVQGMENNLCRCSAYTRVIEAIEMASVEMGGGHE
jgi:aerobic-type carbon monoxide dehydrogenase small subunit (CoxS/CutS family)